MILYKHIVYNTKQTTIAEIIDGLAGYSNIEGMEWCFIRSQNVTEDTAVAIFQKSQKEFRGLLHKNNTISPLKISVEKQ